MGQCEMRPAVSRVVFQLFCSVYRKSGRGKKTTCIEAHYRVFVLLVVLHILRNHSLTTIFWEKDVDSP